MKRNVLVLGFLLLATAFAVVPGAAAQGTSFELLAGVVVDRAGNRVFSMKPGGGVEAIDARSGRVLFTSSSADKPLALWGGLLAAQQESRETPGRLAIVLIDTGRPSRTRAIEVELPEGELALVDETLGRTFSATGAERDGAFLVGWNASKVWSSPIPPPADQPEHEIKTGAVRMDLTAGRVVAVEPALLKDEEPLPEAALAFATEPNLFGPPIRVGALVVSTQTKVADDGAQRIVLKRWSAAGSVLPEVELFRGRPIGQWPSADRRHLLISERVAPGERDEYRWNIYSLETGARVGQLRNRYSRAYFAVDGTRLIHDVWPYSQRVDGKMVEFNRQVQAVDLASGALLWRRPLRDTRYRGPYPP